MFYERWIMMNICFFLGKIVSDLNFKFAVGSKFCSRVKFEIEIDDVNRIFVEAYDDEADLCYQILKKGDIVLAKGRLSDNSNILVDVIEKLI